jgi:hypothetical protein
MNPAPKTADKRIGNAGRKGIDMPHDRRSFIRRFGITLGSLIASGSLPGCGKRKDGDSSETGSQVKEQDKPSATPTAEGQVTKQDQPSPTLRTPEWEAEGQVTKQDKPSPTPRRPAWEELRQCWLKLATLDDDIREAERGLKARFPTEEAVNQKARIAVHRAWLQHLVAEGELKEPVAEHMQTAFEEAVDYLVRSVREPKARGSGPVCYVPVPIGYIGRKNYRADLLQQTEVLRKMSGDLDPGIVAQAQAAIAQDVAFFELFRTSPNDYGVYKRDSEPDLLRVSPEALEAARLLAQLFPERPG